MRIVKRSSENAMRRAGEDSLASDREVIMKYADIVNTLREVGQNNSREWYMEHRELFKEIHIVLNDMYFKVGNKLREEAEIDIAPAKSISRPYNDQRFGNKPYLKEALWITFQSNAVPAPAFFTEFSPFGIRTGMGYYAAAPAQMRDLRKKIDDAPEVFSDRIEEALADKDIEMIGEAYRKKFASDYEGVLEKLYNYKSVYFQKIVPADDWERLEQISTDTFSKLAPLYGLFRSCQGNAD